MMKLDLNLHKLSVQEKKTCIYEGIIGLCEDILSSLVNWFELPLKLR